MKGEREREGRKCEGCSSKNENNERGMGRERDWNLKCTVTRTREKRGDQLYDLVWLREGKKKRQKRKQKMCTHTPSRVHYYSRGGEVNLAPS